MYFTMCNCSPSGTSAATVARPTSGYASVRTAIRAGPWTSCCIPAAMRRPLTRVLCTRMARHCPSLSATYSSLTSGDSSAAAVRGSRPESGSCSLATSSDWVTSRTVPSIGSTVYEMAAMARWVSETSRTEVTRTLDLAGEVQSTCRVSVPACRSSTRSCALRVP